MEWLADDEDNDLGAAQRIATKRYALGLSRKPSASAKLLMAEVLLRSLEFESAPELGSERWSARVRRAESLFDEARQAGVALESFAPLITWLAGVHFHGAGDFAVDFDRGISLLEIAARFGDEEALELKQQIPKDAAALAKVRARAEQDKMTGKALDDLEDFPLRGEATPSRLAPAVFDCALITRPLDSR
jgi:hypothetical protein